MGDLEILKVISLQIASGREEAELFHLIVTKAVKLLNADAGGIALFDENAQSFSFSFVHNLPKYVSKVRFKQDSGLFSEVIQEQASKRVDDYGKQSGKLDELARAGIRAIALVPLIARKQVIGVLWVCMRTAKRTFSAQDITLLESVGGQAAVAMNNIRLFEQQRHIAETLQRGLAPQHPPLKNVDVGLFYESATIAAVVGGDFYDITKITDEEVGITLGDVSGKGVEATADAAMVKFTIRAVEQGNPEPEFILSTANDIVGKQLISGNFVTLINGSYNLTTGKFTFANAGHPYPLLYKEAERKVAQIKGQDPAFSLVSDYRYKQVDLQLAVGDILVLYSDGIIELRRDGQLFTMEKLGGIVTENAELSAQEIANKVIDEARDFAKGRLTDDIALMIIKRLPVS